MGLFGKKAKTSRARESLSPPSRGSALELPQNSVEGHADASKDRTKQAPLRRGTIPRQPSNDHMAPPPISEGEVDAISELIADLSRCVDNPALFDILLSDVDRNRLTQMTMILAERGDFPAMSRVMELTDSLDRLINQRFTDTHKQQRLSLGTDDPQLESIEDAIRHVEAVIADPPVSASELKNKIVVFDNYIHEFQTAPFDRIVFLSDKIDQLRKLLPIRAKPDLPSAAEADEPWVAFPSDLLPVAGSPQPAEWVIDHPPADPDPEPDTVPNDVPRQEITEHVDRLPVLVTEAINPTTLEAVVNIPVDPDAGTSDLIPVTDQPASPEENSDSPNAPATEEVGGHVSIAQPIAEHNEIQFVEPKLPGLNILIGPDSETSDPLPDTDQPTTPEVVPLSLTPFPIEEVARLESSTERIVEEDQTDGGNPIGPDSETSAPIPDTAQPTTPEVVPGSLSAPVTEAVNMHNAATQSFADGGDAKMSGTPSEFVSRQSDVVAWPTRASSGLTVVTTAVARFDTLLPVEVDPAADVDLSAEVDLQGVRRPAVDSDDEEELALSRDRRLRLSSFRAWSHLRLATAFSHTVDRQILRSLVGAWRRYTQTSIAVRSQCESRTRVSCLRAICAWAAVTNESQQWLSEVIHRREIIRATTVFGHWKLACVPPELEDVPRTSSTSQIMGTADDESVSHRPLGEYKSGGLAMSGLEQPVSPLRDFGILASGTSLVPTSPEAWLEEFRLDSGPPDPAQTSIPPSVEHYLIHDPQNSPTEQSTMHPATSRSDLAPIIQTSVTTQPAQSTVRDIKKSTEDVITRAQVFLSSRRIQPKQHHGELPSALLSSHPHSVHDNVYDPTNPDYLTWFERKWDVEAKRWNL